MYRSLFGYQRGYGELAGGRSVAVIWDREGACATLISGLIMSHVLAADSESIVLN